MSDDDPQRIKVLAVSADSMSMLCEGIPLDEIGLDGLEIVDEDGDVIGPFLGFHAFAGETMKEAIERSLPLGCSIRIPQARRPQ